MDIVLHGIDNCDSCRAARRWLVEHGIAYRFHDLRRDGLDRSRIEGWLARASAQDLLNRRGQSWRRLSEAARLSMHDEPGIIEGLLAQPLLVRRPVLEGAGQLLIGFAEPAYARLLETVSGHPRDSA